MRRVLLDTNAYVAFKRGDEAVVELIRLADEIVLSSVVLGELLAGFAAGEREAANREELARFLASRRVTVVPVDEGTADAYARVFALLRRKGRPIPVNDLWIAATVLQHGLHLVTFDQHFAAIEGLAIATTPSQLVP
ncbi:MAG: type II toxin-antitoxin system VapC family toxin [Thermoanaerobaculaceae bacterium]